MELDIRSGNLEGMANPAESERSYTPEGSPPARRRRLQSNGASERLLQNESTPRQRSDGDGSEAGRAGLNVSVDSLQTVSNFLNKLSTLSEQNYNVSVNDKDIGEFNPFYDDVELWLKKLDEYALIYRWNDNYVRHLAINKLRGTAETWYKTLEVVPRDWPEFQMLMLRAFPRHGICTL